MKLWFALTCVFTALAQTNPNAATNLGRVSGIVRDMGTGTPIKDATVYLNTGPNSGREVTTDAEGRYSFANVAPGSLRMGARLPYPGSGFPTLVTRMVQLAPGQSLEAFHLDIVLPGELSGTVYDQNKEPVSEAWVYLVAREYSLGALRYVYAGMAVTNDQGAYTLKGLRSGRAYLLMAQKSKRKWEALSDAPADPALRKPAYVATFYPGAAGLEGAQAVVMRAGEHREAVDLRLLRSKSYCIEATVRAEHPTLRFEIANRSVTSGAVGDGFMYIATSGGMVSEDRKLRLCDLAPGDYALTVFSQDGNAPRFYGSTNVSVLDRDVRNVVVVPQPTVAIRGDVSWAGEAPATPITSELMVMLRPATRAPFANEMTHTTVSLPGEFSFPKMLSDFYSVELRGLPAEVYVKEVTYGGQDALREPLHVGSGLGDTPVRVVLARDGGTVSAKVADKDGNAIADARVLVMLTTASSEAAFAGAIVAGQCDQNGIWTSRRLRPGKYYVAAFTKPHDNSPESIGRLWGNRNHFKEVELAASGKAEVTVTPMSLD